MSFTYKQTQIVKGMLARGDKQHDIAAFFGVNGGRIAEVSTGNCDYPNAQPLPEAELPPEGPYPSPYDVLKAQKILMELPELIASASSSEAKEVAKNGIYKALDILKSG